MGKHFKTLPGLLGFTGFWIYFLNFVTLKGQQIETFKFSRMVRQQLRQFAFDALQLDEQTAHSVGVTKGSGKGIDECELAAAVQKRLLFMLTMNIQKSGCDFTKRRNGAWLIVDENAVPFVRRDF